MFATTATIGNDFTFDPNPKNLDIPVGNYDQEEFTMVVPITIDGVVEDDEIIEFDFPMNAGELMRGDANKDNTTKGTLKIKIKNDDAYSLSIVKTIDGEEPGTDTQFTISVNPANNTGGAITGDIAYSGTATNGTDYVTGATNFSIANGATSAVITLDTTDDVSIESNESIIATISNASSRATIATDNAMAILKDNDIATLAVDTNTIDNLSVSVPENAGTDTFKVKLGAQPATDVVLTITSNNTGEATVDKSTLTFTGAN
jgi:hypothetical protein